MCDTLDGEIGESGEDGGEIVTHGTFHAASAFHHERIAAILGPAWALPI